MNSDLNGYRNFVRRSQEVFTELVESVGPVIKKPNTRFHKSLPAGLKIAITLRNLATGNTSQEPGVWLQGCL